MQNPRLTFSEEQNKLGKGERRARWRDISRDPVNNVSLCDFLSIATHMHSGTGGLTVLHYLLWNAHRRAQGGGVRGAAAPSLQLIWLQWILKFCGVQNKTQRAPKAPFSLHNHRPGVQTSSLCIPRRCVFCLIIK